MKPEIEDIRLLYVDLFCGAGGTSTGVENAVVAGKKIARVIACVNHDPHAIASHLANHHSEDTVHYTENIRTLAMEPLANHVDKMRKKYPVAKVVLWASLECTQFSRAKGGLSRDPDSRTLAEHLFRYVEAIRPDIIQIENVEEFTHWAKLVVRKRPDGSTVMVKKTSGKGKDKKTWEEPGMYPDPEHDGECFHKWVRKMCSYGYTFEYRILNSADYGAYTSRSRFFGQFVSKGLPMAFPMPTHAKNPERNLFGEQLLHWKPVREVLDLQDEGQSIFDRKKPLVDATLRRIYAGLKKFVAGGESAFLTKAFGGNPSEKCQSLRTPAGTVTVKDHHQFITAYYGRGGAHSIEEPSPTITTKDRLAMIYLDKQYGTGVPCSTNQPCPTIETVPKIKPVTVHFIDNQYGQSRCSSVDAPSGTLTVNPKQALVEAKVAPWLMQTNYDNVGQKIDEPVKTITADRHWTYLLNPQFSCPGNSVDKPAPTVIARQDKKPLSLATAKTYGRHPSFVKETDEGLAYEVYATDSEIMRDIKAFMAAYGIIDISMRMLRIKELKLIQGFPEDYILVGTQEEQKKYLGNAVVTIVAQRWCEALAPTIFPDILKNTKVA
jgi:Site-specific DNA methylase